jgi:hypothetical protein
MPFSVLKCPKTIPSDISVVGEFETEDDARKFVAESKQADVDEQDYSVEFPPHLTAPGSKAPD